MEVLRATELWQQTGAYYVRIQAMAKKHHITLREEFDEHDGEGTKYIVLLDEDFPVATARMYALDETSVMIGRVVVLPEYRRRGYGLATLDACELWAEDLFYTQTVVECPKEMAPFFEASVYEARGEAADPNYVRMEKDL